MAWKEMQITLSYLGVQVNEGSSEQEFRLSGVNCVITDSVFLYPGL